MEVIQSTDEMQKRCKELRSAGKTIALVPTMGLFHEGHLELMRAGKKHSDVLVVSIFVNPTQFGPNEDYGAYPRDMEGDLKKAKEVGVNIAYTPPAEEVYPEGFQTKITVEEVSKPLCGKVRPGHFDGVTTIVAKLFNTTKPHLALFGQKDYQQLTVISRMVKDLNMDIDIVGIPTFREPDGLAMSSRNSYLSPDERKSALCLHKSIRLTEDMVRGGKKNVNEITAAIERLINSYPHTRVDYVNLCDPVTLEDIDAVEGEFLLALAVFVGKARLIDNGLIAVS